MSDYRVLGGCLRSPIDFPELPEIPPAEPTWELFVSDSAPRNLSSESLGSDPVRGQYSVENFRTSLGYRLVYGDTGVYDILESGSVVRWYPPAEDGRPWSPSQFMEAVRIDILGRVLALAMHAQGVLCLHGSAVELGGKAITFLAPKFHGKSTLAYALVAAGAGLITDDTVPIVRGKVPMARPGVHAIRMWEDSAAELAGAADSFDMGSFGKLQSRSLGHRLVDEAVQLEAIYVLLPVPDGEGLPAAQRQALEPLPAALSLVQHAKLGPLLGKTEAVRLLDWAGDLSRSVPVHALRVARDFARLPEVVDFLMSHHPS